MVFAEELLAYACSRFEEGNYEEALEAFILVYTKGYQQEWILDNIYNCYLEGNQEEFKETYQGSMHEMDVPYEECTLDFVPYKNGEYYIFDKEIKRFLGIFSVFDFQNAKLNQEFYEMEFSSVALIFKWNWNETKNVLAAAKERKIYAVCQDMKRGCSFFKIPELKEYSKNIKLFADYQKFQEYFHKDTAEYLPHIFFGKEEEVKRLGDVVKYEHLYRLTPEGRNCDNILLTIGIPTYNRGNLLLKRLERLRTMFYDSEIEIVISKNGMELYQKEYEEASRILDERICYFGYNETLMCAENWRHVVEMAHGKYVLFVSDEDDVILEALEHYLKILEEHPCLSLVRAGTVFQNAALEKKYAKKGKDAFELMFLSQNYLSGLIVRKKDFIEENLQGLEQYRNNVFYDAYPHEWWCALLTKRGDAMMDPVLLVSEGESVLEEETKFYQGSGIWKEDNGMLKNISLPVYATYEARLEQFQGYIDFLHAIMQEDMENIVVGLDIAIRKTPWLLLLARKYGYKSADYEYVIKDFFRMAIEAIDEFNLKDEEKEYLLSVIELSCCYITEEGCKLP